MPILSVITVVKDDATSLRRTLNSLITQDNTALHFSNWELVIVDGSNPSLESELSFGPKNRYFWQQPAGIYSAMNYGVSQARGDYLLFINAGDTLATNETLEKLISLLTDKSPEWAFGRVLFSSDSGRELNEPDWDYEVEARRLFARGLFPSHQGTLIKRDLMNSLNGFDSSYQITSDYHLMLRTSLVAHPLVLDFPLANFQQGGASTQNWRTASREFHRARVEVFNPGGLAKIREWSDSAVGFVKTGLGHAVSRVHRG